MKPLLFLAGEYENIIARCQPKYARLDYSK